MTITNRRTFMRGLTALGTVTAFPLASSCAQTPSTRAEKNPYALRSGSLDTPFLPRRGYADGPYGQVHFRDTGTGMPLVLCHQAPQSSRQFTNVYEPLHRRGFRVIGIDLPGFGESDPMDFVPTIEDWASIVPAVLDHLKIARADIVGHHTGSLVATEVALQFPDRVRRVVLNGPFPLDDEGRRNSLKGLGRREVEFVYQPDGKHLVDSFAVRNKFYGKGADPKTINRYVIDKFQGYAPFWTGHHAAFIYDHKTSLKSLKHPTMILTNTGDQIYDLAVQAHKIRPDFSFTALEGGGIDIVDQMPEKWADAIAEYLKS